MAIFGKNKYTLVKVRKKTIPDGLWIKCPDCQTPHYRKTLKDNLNICPKCNFHLQLTSDERINILLDKGTFKEHDPNLVSGDPLKFQGPKTYQEKLKSDRKRTNLKDAVMTGVGKMNGKDVAIGLTDSRFIMGSMGSVVGERITRITEYATKNKLPLVIISGSGGGARMYEGIFSLMQMAKTCAALGRHSEAKLLHISVLTNPTMAGIMASFAGVGDVIMAEPKALIGFAGPRVIEQTIRQKLPAGFQRSEFLIEHGLIDMIVDRKDLKETISKVIKYTKKL